MDQLTVSVIGWIGATATVIIVFITAASSIIEIARALGLQWPKWIFRVVEERELERFDRYLDRSGKWATANADHWIKRIFQNEEAYIKSHQDFMINSVLYHLGVPAADLNSVSEHVRNLRFRSRKTDADARAILDELCRQHPILIDTATLRDPLYREVRYYLNFVDAMAEKNRADIIVDLMADHIRRHLSASDLGRSVIVTSANGNVALGLETARVLRRPSLLMRDRPRIEQGQYWDGSPPHDGILILVHDVAVSGDQLVSAHDQLYSKGFECRRIFCLIERTDKDARRKVEARSMSLTAILQLDDEALSNRH